ncbi:MAG: hypothetical protein R3F20_06235 [Planctomycetota bacterium]
MARTRRDRSRLRYAKPANAALLRAMEHRRRRRRAAEVLALGEQPLDERVDPFLVGDPVAYVGADRRKRGGRR